MRAPYFWSAGLDPQSRESAPFLRLMLTPFASLYAFSSARRIAKATPVKVSRPVICIGNITSGGSGKTPIVQALRAQLVSRGISAASLSRGYGGKQKGPLAVTASTHTAKDVGDEPAMLAQTGLSWVSADRVAGAKTMIAAGVEAIIMDDGHQNPYLHKDLSILVIDAAAPFGNGYVLPKGPLREPVGESLARADTIILMGDGPPPQSVQASGLPLFRARLQPKSPPPPGPLIAFAGIGRPERFYQSLQAAKGDLIDHASFGDHHVYTDAQLKHLHAHAAAHGARLVTTEKDFIRLHPGQREGITPFCVDVAFDDETGLMALLLPLFQAAKP